MHDCNEPISNSLDWAWYLQNLLKFEPISNIILTYNNWNISFCKKIPILLNDKIIYWKLLYGGTQCIIYTTVWVHKMNILFMHVAHKVQTRKGVLFLRFVYIIYLLCMCLKWLKYLTTLRWICLMVLWMKKKHYCYNN